MRYDGWGATMEAFSVLYFVYQSTCSWYRGSCRTAYRLTLSVHWSVPLSIKLSNCLYAGIVCPLVSSSVYQVVELLIGWHCLSIGQFLCISSCRTAYRLALSVHWSVPLSIKLSNCLYAGIVCPLVSSSVHQVVELLIDWHCLSIGQFLCISSCRTAYMLALSVHWSVPLYIKLSNCLYAGIVCPLVSSSVHQVVELIIDWHCLSIGQFLCPSSCRTAYRLAYCLSIGQFLCPSSCQNAFWLALSVHWSVPLSIN